MLTSLTSEISRATVKTSAPSRLPGIIDIFFVVAVLITPHTSTRSFAPEEAIRLPF